MESRRLKRSNYPQTVRLGLLEDDVDTMFRALEHMDKRQDGFDLWRVKVVTVVSVIAAIGAVAGGVLADVIARYVG